MHKESSVRLISCIKNKLSAQFAQLFLAAFVLPLIVMNGSFAQTPTAAKPLTNVSSDPTWAELSAQQKTILAPLASDWTSMGEIQRKKWVVITNRYAALKPDEQKRIQERMHDWAKLTPEQRMQARENMARAQKLHPDQKNAHWQQYQQLSEEQKQALAASASKKKSVTNLPPKNESAEKLLVPLKKHSQAISSSLPHAMPLNVVPASQAATPKP
jgi:hypothetical protein